MRLRNMIIKLILHNFIQFNKHFNILIIFNIILLKIGY